MPGLAYQSHRNLHMPHMAHRQSALERRHYVSSLSLRKACQGPGPNQSLLLATSSLVCRVVEGTPRLVHSLLIEPEVDYQLVSCSALVPYFQLYSSSLLALPLCTKQEVATFQTIPRWLQSPNSTLQFFAASYLTGSI
jgi:hypothetical protein